MLGKYCYITSHKPDMEQPTGLCLALRKRLTNTIIKKIEQIEGQRILQFEIDTKEGKKFLIFELFSRGNLILTHADKKIMLLQEQKTWQTRELKPGNIYVYPPQDMNWKQLTLNTLSSLLKNSKKNKLVTSLATELGLGGVYAEEFCHRAGVDKNQNPQEIGKEDKKTLYDAFKTLIEDLENPHGYVYEENVTPIKITHYGKPLKKFSSFNEALDKELSKTKHELEREAQEELYTQKLQTLRHRLQEQEGHVKKLEKTIDENQHKGELIYEQYAYIEELLTTIKQEIAQHGWEDTRKKLKKGKIVKNINPKEKTIEIEL